jgi:hypothetical protein
VKLAFFNGICCFISPLLGLGFFHPDSGHQPEQYHNGGKPELQIFVPPESPELFLPLKGGASGHFYSEPSLFGDKHELAYVVWEEGVVCVVIDNYLADRWTTVPGPECGFPGTDRFPSYCGKENRLYFTSSRKTGEMAEPGPSSIWFVSGGPGGGWNEKPQLLDMDHGMEEITSLSVTADGDLIFEGSKTCLATAGRVFCSSLREDLSREVSEILVLVDHHQSDESPCMAPDGSFIVFQSDRPGGFGEKDLYAVFSRGNQTWSDPVNLGDTVNGPHSEYLPRISSDGSILFFSRSTVDPHDQCEFPETMWVDTQFIERLR